MSLMRGKSIGFVRRKFFQTKIALDLTPARLGHWPVARCSRVPGSSLQPGIWHWPVEPLVQCLLNQQVLYLPDTIRAWTVAFLTSKGLQPALDQMGWVLSRDMDSQWKSDREGRRAASPLNLTCHQSNTFSFTILLKTSLGGGLARIVRGSGRQYWTESDFKLCKPGELIIGSGCQYRSSMLMEDVGWP